MKEALKLALEALEVGFMGPNIVKYNQAITAVKEALAQPEYDYKDLYEKEKRSSAMWLAKYEKVAGPVPKAYPVAQPEQEPCGGCGGSGWVPRDPDIGTDQECFVCDGSGQQPKDLEQEPVAKNQWWAEAKLKEKNT